MRSRGILRYSPVRNWLFSPFFFFFFRQLREIEGEIAKGEQLLRVCELEKEMQQMYIYLYYEIDNTEMVQVQQKLVVAEFGLLDV